MAVAFGAVGTVASGATSAAPAHTSPTANAQLLLTATCKPDTSTFPTISGWTLQVDVSVGSGAGGPGVGPQRLACYTRTADGTEGTGTVTVTPSGTPNVVQAVITWYTVAAGKVFDLDIATGSDTTSGVDHSSTADHTIGETANDWMFRALATSANSNQGSTTTTATGATYGTSTERVDAGTNTGDDSRLSNGDRPVTSGTATAATVCTSTIAGTQTGGTVFVRLREVDPPAAALPPVFVSQYSGRF